MDSGERWMVGRNEWDGQKIWKIEMKMKEM